jgi:hypothetical protein
MSTEIIACPLPMQQLADLKKRGADMGKIFAEIIRKSDEDLEHKAA